jgi:hypothetical protein
MMKRRCTGVNGRSKRAFRAVLLAIASPLARQVNPIACFLGISSIASPSKQHLFRQPRHRPTHSLSVTLTSAMRMGSNLASVMTSDESGEARGGACGP